jgi:LDH2 family malate/lactate/ureidoglycolate dehydrogenase
VANPRLVPYDKLKEVERQIFAACGVSPADAAVIADTLTQADLRGVHSHGAMRLEMYVRRLRDGGINPKPNIKLAVDFEANAVVDGDKGMGQVVAYFATKLAMEKAGKFGTGSVTVRNSNHCGAMAFYSMMMADAGYVGYCATNAGILMTPFGGAKNLVGVNPFAFAVPAGQPFPFVLDMATSMTAMGKVNMARIRGQKIPVGWAVDSEGNPTEDPAKAEKGSLLPVGGPKGYGMALMLDIQSGILSQGRFGAGLGSPGVGHFFQAMKVETFLPMAKFQEEMGQLITQLKTSPLAPGFKEIFLPGEIEHNLTTDRIKNGVPIEQDILDQIEGLAVEVGATTKPSLW